MNKSVFLNYIDNNKLLLSTTTEYQEWQFKEKLWSSGTFSVDLTGSEKCSPPVKEQT